MTQLESNKTISRSAYGSLQRKYSTLKKNYDSLNLMIGWQLSENNKLKELLHSINSGLVRATRYKSLDARDYKILYYHLRALLRDFFHEDLEETQTYEKLKADLAKEIRANKDLEQLRAISRDTIGALRKQNSKYRKFVDSVHYAQSHDMDLGKIFRQANELHELKEI